MSLLFTIFHRYLQAAIETFPLDDLELNMELTGFLNGLRRDLQRASAALGHASPLNRPLRTLQNTVDAIVSSLNS